MDVEFKGNIREMSLTDNPFRVVPHTNPTIWAGRETVKENLERIIKNGLILSPIQLVLIWGDWGTGKTHASRYFNHFINNETKALSICIRCPRPSKGLTPFLHMYINFLRDVGTTNLVDAMNFIWDEIRKQKKAFLDEIDGTKFREELGGRSEPDYLDFETEREIEKFIGDSDLSRVLLSLRESDLKLIAWKWLTGSEKKSDLDDLQVTSVICNDPSALSAFGAILRILTFRSTETTLRPAVFLWIDEMETLVDLFGASEQLTFLTGIRDLTDEAPNDVSIFLMFTATDSEEVIAIIGEAIAARLTENPYELSSIEKNEDAKMFIVSLLNNEIYRSSEMKENIEDENFPFEEETIDYIIEQTELKTPRRLMVNFGKVIEKALYEGIIKTTKDRISKVFAAKVLME